MTDSNDIRDVLGKAGYEPPPWPGAITPDRLVDEGWIGDDTLADLLARSASTVVFDLDRSPVDRDAARILPETVARRLLALPVALDERGLRVAFANPLDRRALAEVAQLTGRTIRIVAAGVLAVRRAIDREFGHTTGAIAAVSTRVLHDSRDGMRPDSSPPDAHDAHAGRRADSHRPDSHRPDSHRPDSSRPDSRSPDGRPDSRGPDGPLPPEPTQRVMFGAKDDGRAPATMPIHRIEDEASVEQRFEALLLAMIDRGVITRSDYADALRRLMRK